MQCYQFSRLFFQLSRIVIFSFMKLGMYVIIKLLFRISEYNNPFNWQHLSYVSQCVIWDVNKSILWWVPNDSNSILNYLFLIMTTIPFALDKSSSLHILNIYLSVVKWCNVYINFYFKAVATEMAISFSRIEFYADFEPAISFFPSCLVFEEDDFLLLYAICTRLI